MGFSMNIYIGIIVIELKSYRVSRLMKWDIKKKLKLWFIMNTYIQTILANKWNSFCNSLINMHSLYEVCFFLNTIYDRNSLSSPFNDLHTPIHFWFCMTCRSVHSQCTYVWFGSCNFIFFCIISWCAALFL